MTALSERPSLADIYQRICTDIELYLPGAAARAPESLLSTLASAEAGVAHELYGFLEWIALQILPDTADEDTLVRWSALLAVPRLNDEPLKVWRSRIVKALQERSKIGDADDYVRWAIASHVAITHAWVETDAPLGDVPIVVMTGLAASVIPDAAILAEAQTALARLRNVGCRVYVRAPVERVVPIIISGVPEALRTAITEAIRVVFLRKLVSGARLLEAEIDAAIQNYTLNYTLVSPTTDFQAAAGELLTFGGVEWLA